MSILKNQTGDQHHLIRIKISYNKGKFVSFIYELEFENTKDIEDISIIPNHQGIENGTYLAKEVKLYMKEKYSAIKDIWDEKVISKNVKKKLLRR